MKYLKRYNESVEVPQRVRDFCLDHLAYLLDKGYNFRTERIGGTTEVIIEKDDFWKTRVVGSEERSRLDLYFDWDETKDYLIPFFTHLKRHYGTDSPTLIEFYFTNDKKPIKVVLIDDVISDSFTLNNVIGYIKFSVVNKV